MRQAMRSLSNGPFRRMISIWTCQASGLVSLGRMERNLGFARVRMYSPTLDRGPPGQKAVCSRA